MLFGTSVFKKYNILTGRLLKKNVYLKIPCNETLHSRRAILYGETMVKMHKILFYHLLVHVVPTPFFLRWNINFDARLHDSHHLLSLYGRKTQLKWMGTEYITSFFHKRKPYKFQHCKLWQNFLFSNLLFILFIKVIFYEISQHDHYGSSELQY